MVIIPKESFHIRLLSIFLGRFALKKGGGEREALRLFHSMYRSDVAVACARDFRERVFFVLTLPYRLFLPNSAYSGLFPQKSALFSCIYRKKAVPLQP